ncbi:MAG: glycosyltransferase family 9 protein [Prevotellaceae bacterium]|nr:glycosyltransferase family 9 protein [Prevotellaceae bacterium]
MNILVIRLSALGDVAMTIPAIYSCAYCNPDCTLHVVTSEFCAQLFIGAPDNVKLHLIGKDIQHGMLGTLRIIRQLHVLHIDAVADLHNVLRSWIIDWSFRLRGRRVQMLDKMRHERKQIVRQGKSASQPFTERYFNVFRKLGLKVNPLFTSVLKDDKTSYPDFSSVLPNDKLTPVGIAPFARYKNKTYPLPLMEQVVAKLSADSDFRILLFSGGKTESEQLKEWQNKYTNTVSVAKRFTLADEVRLMSRLKVMVSMDSANMHMASLVGCRVISVWGSTTPRCGFLGWQQNKSDALATNCKCQPCTIAGSERCRCGDYHCLTNMTPDKIYNTIKEITKT